MMRNTYRTLFIFLGLFFIVPVFSYAAQLQNMSDTISNSNIGANATHSISFINTNEIEQGGEIKIRFDGNLSPFIFSQTFDFTNIGLSIDRGSGFIEYPLDSFSDEATSTAYLVQNGDGEISIRLAYGYLYSIPKNSKIKINIGANQSSSDVIINPINLGSHLITISTFDSSSNQIDLGKTMIATTNPVGIRTGVKGVAATIFNGLPKGVIPGGTKNVFISVETTIPAFCKYSLVPDIEYDNVSNVQRMKFANFYRLHSLVIPVTDGVAYKYYIRCFSKYGLEVNKEDYPISFEVGVTSTDVNPPPPPPGTQSGNNTGGGNMLPQSDLTIVGYTFPGSQVVILKDGKEFKTITADSQGLFNTSADEMDRGTYTFTITSVKDGVRSASYSTTIYVNGSTRNTIGPVYLSPVVTSKTQRIDLGGQPLVFGKAAPLLVVQAVIVGPKDPLQQPYVVASTTANGAGDWSLTMNMSKLPKGTYSFRSQTLIPGQGNSQFSPEFLIGVGEKPAGDNKKRADLNNDGKVNIADLSILLFNWKKSSAVADINIDGTVNITDFSIMLSAWTG